MMKWLWKLLYLWNRYKAKSLEVQKFQYELWSKQIDIGIKKRIKTAENYYERF